MPPAKQFKRSVIMLSKRLEQSDRCVYCRLRDFAAAADFHYKALGCDRSFECSFECGPDGSLMVAAV